MNRKIAGLLAMAMLAGCGGGGGNAGSMTPAAPGSLPSNLSTSANGVHLAPFHGSPGLANFEWGKTMLERMHYVAPAQAGALAVDVQVRMRDAHGLAMYALSASDPKSPNFRRFLTPQEIGDRFGASKDDYDSVARYFAKLGMRVGMWPQREILSVTGTLPQFSRAFNTAFGTYTYGKQTVVGPTGTPHFSTALPVASVMHLETYTSRRGYNIRGSFANFAGYTPQMVASGFDFSGAYSKGYTGAGVNAAINGTGPISPDDMTLYGKLFHASVPTVVQVNASPQPPGNTKPPTGSIAQDPFPAGLTGAPPVTAPCQLPAFPTPPNYKKCNPEDIEAQLDSQQVAGLAPGATELFYLAYNPLICVDNNGNFVKTKKDGTCAKGGFHYPLMGIQLADDSLQQSIADNRADSMSLSWGEPENDAAASGYINKNLTGVGNVEFASLAAEGTAVFVSSGDNGAWECFDPNNPSVPLGIACPSYPATDPNVTAVGGVNAPIDEAGRLSGQITAWADNTTGGGDGNFGNNVGSGGGISMVFDAPAYQADALKGVKKREIPDMSMDADPATGVTIVAYAKWDPFVFAEGGTSASAPEANAEWADVLSACKTFKACATAGGAKPYRLGNAAPWFYKIYEGKANLPYDQVFYDVIYGSNQAKPATPVPASPSPFPTPGGYSAGPGYDMVTGLGVPFVGHLIDAIVAGAAAP